MVVLRIEVIAADDEFLKVIVPKPFEAVPQTGCHRKPVYEPSCAKMISEMASDATVS